MKYFLRIKWDNVYREPSLAIFCHKLPMLNIFPSSSDGQVSACNARVGGNMGLIPRSSIHAWKIPWPEEPGRLQSMGRKESDTTKLLTQTMWNGFQFLKSPEQRKLIMLWIRMPYKFYGNQIMPRGWGKSRNEIINAYISIILFYSG